MYVLNVGFIDLGTRLAAFETPVAGWRWHRNVYLPVSSRSVSQKNDLKPEKKREKK